MIMNLCKWCHKPLTEKQIKKGNPTCSKSCANFFRYKDVQKEFVCRCCGKTYVKKYSGTKNGVKYCSQECARKINFGNPKSEEHKRKIAEAQHHIKVEGNFVCDRCGRFFYTNTSIRAHKAHCGHKLKQYACECCGKLFQGRARLVLHKSFCSDESKFKSWRKNRANKLRLMNPNFYDTNIEIIIEQKMKSLGIDYVKQFRIGSYYHAYDFFIPSLKLIVETDGDFWHGHRTAYHQDSLGRDIEYTQKALAYGYKIIRFWGSDIEQRLDDCIKEILEYGKTGIVASNGLSRKVV